MMDKITEAGLGEPTNTNHNNVNNHNSHTPDGDSIKIEDVTGGKHVNDMVSDGDGELASIMKNAADNDMGGSDGLRYTPPPPKKIAKRSKESHRKSTSSPRLKSSTPTSALSTPGGSLSDREHTSSPASIDNPPTNGSFCIDADGDGERSDKTESDSISSSTIHGTTSNGPLFNHLTSALTKRNVTLPMLLSAGILKPGEGTMTLEYHGQKFVGDLLVNGNIKSQETSLLFTSPSAWAIACKQIINPEKIQRKSGCGWASIKYKGLKLDYYKTVWFKRMREGSIDMKHFSNGTSTTSDESDEEESAYCVLNYGEHIDGNPALYSAQQMGAKVLIACSKFEEIDSLQPFHIKMSSQALAVADFHCNITDTESLGYISGTWNNEKNCLRMETAHPCKVLMPNSSFDCDIERGRVALEVQRLGHDVVGWYHSHPKAPPEPTEMDICRQFDFEITLKGNSETAYVPCVGVIISPLCYTTQQGLNSSSTQLFWVMPPPESRPTELGRPMHLEYDTFTPSDLDTKKILLQLEQLVTFYKERKDLIELNNLENGKFERLKASFTSHLPELKSNKDFWDDVKQLFTLAPFSNLEESNSTGFNTDAINTNNTNTNSVESIEEDTVMNNASTPVDSTTLAHENEDMCVDEIDQDKT